MSRYKKMPFKVLNDYIGNFLETEGVMEKTVNIKGQATPTIIPAAQTPELKDAKSPTPDRAPAFMVYAFELDPEKKTDYAEAETLSYTIYSPSVPKIFEIIYAMKDLFTHCDWSAQEINAFAQSDPSKEKYFHFLETEFDIVSGPLPMEGEGGRYGAIVNVDYVYVNNIIKTPGPGQGMRA